MSVTKETTIWCDGKREDGERCFYWELSAETARELRTELQRRGWRRIGTRDLCPSCAEREEDKDE